MSGTHGPSRPSQLLHGVQSLLRGKAKPHSSGLQPISTYVNGVYLYYPNCQGKMPNNVNLDVISHVWYAFATVNPDGTVHLDPELDHNNQPAAGVHNCLSALCQLRDAKHKHLKIILSFGGGGGPSVAANFASAASTVKSRSNFANSAKKLIDAHKFDGIDVDWEYPLTTEDGANYLLLLQTVRAALPAPRYIVSGALSSGAWALQYIDLAQAAQYMDFMNIMCYDFSGPWTSTAGYQSQLYDPAFPNDPTAGLSCQSAVAYYRSQGVPTKKLLLGIPIYGRSFLGAKKPGDKYTGVGGDDGTFDYKELPRPGAKEIVDKKAGAAYCIGGDGGFVTYDNPETVMMKAKFVKENGLGGLFYWSGPSDATGARSLTMAGHSALHGLIQIELTQVKLKSSEHMLFTWNTENLCIVFEGWHVNGTGSLIASLIGVILLTAGYELVRELSRRYEAATARKMESLPRRSAAHVEQRSRLVKAMFYAVQVFYSFFIMLLFMTYNGWIMLAVAVGAFIGYMAFGSGAATKTVACH